jgi:hypothetical protein
MFCKYFRTAASLDTTAWSFGLMYQDVQLMRIPPCLERGHPLPARSPSQKASRGREEEEFDGAQGLRSADGYDPDRSASLLEQAAPLKRKPSPPSLTALPRHTVSEVFPAAAAGQRCSAIDG